MMNKKNILISSAFSDFFGGGQKSIFLMLKYLDKSKYNLFLLTSEKGELADRASEQGVKSVTFSVPSFRPWKLSKEDKVNLKSIISDNKIDIIHTESFRDVLWFRFLFKNKLKIIFHARVGDGWFLGDLIVSILANHIISASNCAQRRFSLLSRKNKSVVYNGVDVFEQTNSYGTKNTLIYFGRIHPKKRVDWIIRALKELNYTGEFKIYGAGESNYVETLKQISDGIDVKFCGFVKSINNEIKKADLVLFPSIFKEGLSRTVIETMALAKPILVSDVESNLEAVGLENVDFHFKKNSFVDFKFKLSKLLESDLEVKSLRLYQRAKALFSAEANAKHIENIYSTL